MICDSCDDTITLYMNRDNAVTVIPYSDFSERTNYDMATVTRVVANADLVDNVVVGDSVVGDSDDDPGLVWWDQVDTGELDSAGDPILEWRIYCKVGLFTDVQAGDYTLRVTIFDPGHPNGLVLPRTDSELLVTIVDLP
jgi:hypothetical protein